MSADEMRRILLDMESGMLALHKVAREGHSAWVQSILSTGIVGINTTDLDGCTALHLAAYNGHLDTVVLLITTGAELETRDRFGQTAFDRASGKGHERIARLLSWASIHARASLG